MKDPMNETNGKFSAPGEVRFVRRLPASIERVWDFLTKSEQRGLWLAAGKMDLRVGGAVELNFHHRDLTPHVEPVAERYRQLLERGYHMTGHITRLEPPRMLSFTWDEGDGGKSEVTFELTSESENRTQLLLVHRRLGDDRDESTSICAGWHTHLAILIARLADAPVPPFWSVHARLVTEYTRLLDAAK